MADPRVSESVQRAAFGGTPTVAYDARQGKTENAVWNAITKAWEFGTKPLYGSGDEGDIGRAVGDAQKVYRNINPSFEQAPTGQRDPYGLERYQQVRDDEARADRFSNYQGLAAKGVGSSVVGAMELAEFAWSHAVSRPIATYNLLLADKFDEDADRKITVGDAWNRSATVSAGMAITDTSVEILSGLQNMFLNLGASGDNFVDLSDWDVDTWDEKSINEAYQRGEAYSIVTGTVDTAVNLLPIPAGKGTGAIARKAGLSRNAGVRPNLTGEYDRAIDGMIAEGVDPNGRYVGSVYLEGIDEATETTVRAADDEVGTVPSRVAEKADPAPEPERLPSGAPVSISGKNAVSKEIIELTETDDIARIIESPLIREQVGADPTVLASVISETDSYKEVLRIYMALRGDTTAAAKLFETNKAAAAQISGVFDVLNKAEPGAMVQLTEDTHEALLQSMTPAESRLYKALVIDGGFASQGYRTLRTGMAGSSPLARATQKVARGLEWGVGAKADLRAAAKSQDFKRITQSRVGTRTKTAPDGTVYQEAIVGSRYGLLTKIIDFNPKLGKSLKKKATNTFGRVPLNVFSYARTRPTDAIDEFYAMVGDSPVLTSGGMVKVGDFADEITAQEWIAGASKRLADAQGTSVGKLKETFSEIEREMAVMIGISKGLSEAKTLEILNGFKYKAQQLMGEVQKRQGFYDTGSGMQISFDKETISMLADSEMLVPLDDFAKHLELEDVVNGVMGRGFVRTSQGAKTAFDLGQSFFRTGMLLKPGYIMRNAFFEPGVTAAIAHMGTVPHKMAWNAAQGTLNFGLNMFDRINGRVMKTLSPNSRRKLVAAENRYIAAMNARDKILLDLDEIEEGARRPSDLPKRRQLEVARQRATELAMIALRTIAEIDENVAADIASTVDYDFATRVIRGSRSILRGNDKKLNQVAKEINDLENSGVLDLELGELDLAYIDKLYMEYEVLLAVREAREGLRTPGQRGVKDTGKPMLPGKDKDNLEPVVFRDTGDTGTSTMVYQNVQKLLKTYARRSADILYDDSYNDALGEITKATEELVEAASVYRGERAKYISKTARREKRQARRRRIGEKTKEITLSNGQKVLYREAFAGTKGDAYRVDASGRVTAIQSFAPMGGESAVASLNRLRMNLVETKPIGPTHPQYFEDLHYFATRHVAGDKRIAAALGPKAYDSQGRDVRVKKVYDAVKKDKAFRDEMGIKNLDDAQRYAEEIVDIIETYYPTQAARDLIASNGKYGPGELAEAITSDPNVVLRPIDGHVVKKLDSTPGERVRRTTQKFFETLWNAIAVTPEATLGRWPFYARQHEIAFKRNMETMLAQSPTGKVSIKQQDAAQLAAHREALKELEKTFYTIRRYNRSIFTSRYLQSFPGAWANGLWRYMYYIPKNKPAETLTALLVGKNVLDSVLKDSNGEPTDYWNEDARIVIPLSKGLKMVGVDYDYDWEVSKEGYTRIFADVPPSRSYLSAVTIDSFMQYAPSFMRKRLPDWTIGDKSMDDRADDMQSFVDDMGEYYYEQTGDKTVFEEIIRPALFSEYGPTRKFLLEGVPGTMLGSVTPGWARSLVALGAAKMNKEFTDDYIRIANYRTQVVAAEREASGDDTPIDFAKEVAPQAGSWFLLRFIEQFTNLAAGSVPMPRYPGGLEREEWRKISDENPGMDYEDKVMLLEKKFPGTPVEQLLPFTKSTTKNVYDVPRTVGAFNYVERHSDVAQKIVDEMGDPAMVGLMVMDENYGPSGFSDTVYRAMRDKPPYEGGDNYIMNIPPDEYAVSMDVSRGWNEFEKIDAAFQVEIKRAREAGDRDAVKQLKYDRRRWLKGPNEEPESMRMKFPSWYSRYGPSKDRAELTANTVERYIIGNKKIWNDKKEDPAWLLLQQFLIDRRAALDLKASVTDNEQKARVDEWMYSNYEPLMEQYPMTEDLWDNTFEVEFYEEPEAQ